MHADLSIEARCLNCSPSLHPSILYARAAKALVSLHICAASPEPSLLADAISSPYQENNLKPTVPVKCFLAYSMHCSRFTA